MRTTFSFAAIIVGVTFATSALAGPIVISQVRTGNGSYGTNVPAPPEPIVLQAGQAGDPPSERITLEIPCVHADDPQRILQYSPDDGLARSWEITAANADDYDFDWQEFESALNGSESRISFSLGEAGDGGFARMIESPRYFEDFQLERIEIELDHWFWHAILPSLRSYHVESRIIGEARIVPEPSTLLLAGVPVAALLMGCALLAQRG